MAKIVKLPVTGTRPPALMRIDDYSKLAGDKPRSLLDVMDAIPGGDFEFEPPRLGEMGFKPATSD